MGVNGTSGDDNGVNACVSFTGVVLTGVNPSLTTSVVLLAAVIFTGVMLDVSMITKK